MMPSGCCVKEMRKIAETELEIAKEEYSLILLTHLLNLLENIYIINLVVRIFDKKQIYYSHCRRMYEMTYHQCMQKSIQ